MLLYSGSYCCLCIARNNAGWGFQEVRYKNMNKPPKNLLWLQNNNNSPRRQSNRPGGGRPNGNGQTPQRGPSLLNRWLLIIVGLMLAVYVYMWFNTNANSANAPQRD